MEAAVAARFLQLLATALLCGGALFFLYGWRPGAARWPRPTMTAAGLLGAAATAAGLVLQARTLSDDGAGLALLFDLVTGTVFGCAGLVRLTALAVAAALAAVRAPWVAVAAAGLAATASFAWTGHGAFDDGMAGVVHQACDVVHLVAASLWIGALGVLGVLLWRGRVEAGAREAARLGLRRFSGIGPAVVAALLLSGLANAAFLVGVARVPALAADPYGRLLLLKLAAFAAMLGLAGVNRWVLTPRLAPRLTSGSQAGEAGLGAVSLSVGAETALAVGVLGLVAWLSALAPPAAAG